MWQGSRLRARQGAAGLPQGAGEGDAMESSADHIAPLVSASSPPRARARARSPSFEDGLRAQVGARRGVESIRRAPDGVI